jgi:hypothetical protein
MAETRRNWKNIIGEDLQIIYMILHNVILILFFVMLIILKKGNKYYKYNYIFLIIINIKIYN